VGVQPGLILKHSTFCPHSVFMCFVWIWEQTAIISLYSINWLVCITETECVYCAVRTVSLNTIQVEFRLQWFPRCNLTDIFNADAFCIPGGFVILHIILTSAAIWKPQTTANGVHFVIKHGVFWYTFVTAAVLSVPVTKGNFPTPSAPVSRQSVTG
jgi:hypothetical protein